LAGAQEGFDGLDSFVGHKKQGLGAPKGDRCTSQVFEKPPFEERWEPAIRGFEVCQE
jgi:hypothetical protein